MTQTRERAHRHHPGEELPAVERCNELLGHSYLLAVDIEKIRWILLQVCHYDIKGSTTNQQM